MQGSVQAQPTPSGTQVPSADTMTPMQHLSREQLFRQFHISERGLTSQEAQRRLSEVGFNEPITVQRVAGVSQLFRLFLNPLVAILLIASLVSAFLGDIINASIIVVMVLLGVA